MDLNSWELHCMREPQGDRYASIAVFTGGGVEISGLPGSDRSEQRSDWRLTRLNQSCVLQRRSRLLKGHPDLHRDADSAMPPPGSTRDVT